VFFKFGGTVDPVYVKTPQNGIINFIEKLNEFVALGGTNKVKFIARYTLDNDLVKYAE